ncbi:MAG: TorF family putative porin, partial [Thiohalorhabdaceae bacterium]
ETNDVASLSEYEQDFYAGYADSIGDFSYDVGYIYWAYPLTRDADFGEIYASVGYSYLTIQANYTTNSQGEDVAGEGNVFIEDDLYYKATLDIPVTKDVAIAATVGHYEYADSEADSYNHYNLYINKGDFSFGLEQNDADGEFPTGKQADGPRFVVSWGKTFDLM